MNMEVVDDLAALRAVVDCHPKPVFHLKFVGQTPANLKKIFDFFRRCVHKRGVMSFGADQQMDFGLWMAIFEDNYPLVFKNYRRRCFSADYITEFAMHRTACSNAPKFPIFIRKVNKIDKRLKRPVPVAFCLIPGCLRGRKKMTCRSDWYCHSDRDWVE